MCGIAGILDRRLDGLAEADDEIVERMTRSLAHRGPDAHRTLADGPIRLGHRRLAVVDLRSEADQPLGGEEDGRWIVFNGEIYDHAAQRERLERRGHRFRTRSDTEVVLALYREYGDDCVDHLRGMFAFAVWDGPRRRLFLARDRLGKKPLYYAAGASRFTFASEMKSLLCDPLLPRDLDPAALFDFLSFDYVPGPGTVFAAIRQLPPAHVLVVDASGIRMRRYWSLPGARSVPTDLAGATSGIVDRLAESVRLRLVSDVPVGVFLSGGIDSSAVVALLRRQTSGRIRTFSVGFADADLDERAHARLVAERFETEHEELVFGPSSADLLGEVVAHFDQPFADPAMLPTWELARQARSRITVALTGEGGDELFAGYDRYVKSALARYAYAMPRGFDRGAAALLDRALDAVGSGAGDGFGRRLQAFLALGRPPPADLFARWVLHFDPELKRSTCSRDFWQAVRGRDSAERIREAHRRAAGRDPVNALLDVDVETYLPDDLLVKVDIATMRHSLEARCPFLDHELVEYVAALPGEWKLRGLTTKWILRRALRSLLPRSIRRRRKLGFGPPVGRWLRGAIGDHARDVLTDRRTEQRGYFDPAAVRLLLDDHRQGRRNHGYELWNLLVLELWHRAVADVPCLFRTS